MTHDLHTDYDTSGDWRHDPAELRKRLSALRSRVEALEGERDEALQLDGACSTLKEMAAASFESRAENERLRARVEALEGVLQKIADAPCEREQGCIAHRIARAALQPDKGERLSQQERDTLAEARAIVEGAQATRQEMDRKYDKREAICAECESDPSVTPGTCECPGHRDVSNVRPARTARQQPDKGERCGGTGWLDPRAEHAPCPGCKEDVR